MNFIKINNKVYKYESFWRPKKNKKVLDFNNHLLPYPEEGTDWQNRKNFVEQLNLIQEYLMTKNEFIKYSRDNQKNCLLCGKKNVVTGVFELSNIRWENGLLHYIKVHKIKPSFEFIDLIFTYQIDPNAKSQLSRISSSMGKISAVVERMDNKKYLKVSRNQLLILDALLEHGSYKKYIDTINKKTLYSEHAGLLDFNNTGLERVIIKANTDRLVENENTFLPGEFLPDEQDYEYIFHTHPLTEGIGGRVLTDGVLYDSPSTSDVINFIENHNKNKTQGSIVVAPEGMYIIRKLNMDNKKISLNKNTFWHEFNKYQFEAQNLAIKKHHVEFDFNEGMVYLDSEEFFSKIAKDKDFINNINNFLKKIGVHIDYYPRIKDEYGFWVIDTIYLPIYVVEPDFNIG